MDHPLHEENDSLLTRSSVDKRGTASGVSGTSTGPSLSASTESQMAFSNASHQSQEMHKSLLRSEDNDSDSMNDQDDDLDERTAFLLKGGDAPPMSRDPSYLDEDFFHLVFRRSVVLIILLILQSSSSFVLDFFEKVLKKNYIIVLYLTMIIGSGGNTGSQSAVFIIKGLATGEMNTNNIVRVWKRELRMGALIVGIVGSAAFVRVLVSEIFKVLWSLLFGGSSSDVFGALELLLLMRHTIAVTVSLCLVVMTSICIGMVLPVLFKAIHIDPVHASPVIQVTMDLLGVVITCIVATIVLP